ncbi:MAG: methionyl aminopeptidase [Clostridiales bacterium]|nr:methionyl aminopeptidase [Clostridiales bacterium]
MTILSRNDPCWCGSGKKYKKCHEALDHMVESYRLKGLLVPERAMIKTKAQIDGIRESGLRNVEVLDRVAEKICIGMPTIEIDRIVYETTKALGGIPAPLNYEGYPKSVCTSVNDQVCHGIPDEDAILEDGDIVNVDCSTIFNGYFSDSSRMFMLGDVDPAWRKLVEVTHDAVLKGAQAVKPWGTLADVARTVSGIARANGYSVVREIGGHGVGIEFHEDPWIGYTEPEDEGMLLVPGMVFTVEPMINLGGPEIFEDEDNGWTIYTEDGSPSAQWEVTVAVTEDGHEILAW